MGAYSLDVFAASQIPDPTSLVVGAAGEDALVSWVPDGLIDGLVVLEWVQWPILRRTYIPQPDSGVHGSTEDHSLVDVVPFAALSFCLMTLQNGERLRLTNLPQFECSIAASRQNLIFVGLRKTNIKAIIRRLKLLHYSCRSRTCLQYGHSTCAGDSKILTLPNNNFIGLERTESHWIIVACGSLEKMMTRLVLSH